eukprot:2153801-Pyramimonas_sp.AAC.1
MVSQRLGPETVAARESICRRGGGSGGAGEERRLAGGGGAGGGGAPPGVAGGPLRGAGGGHLRGLCCGGPGPGFPVHAARCGRGGRTAHPAGVTSARTPLNKAQNTELWAGGSRGAGQPAGADG